MNKTIQLTIQPNWPVLSGNTVLEVLAYTTTGFEFSAKISGPGLPVGGLSTANIPGDKPFFSPSNQIPNYQPAIPLDYEVEITCNTGFNTEISQQQELGLKDGELPISYQRTIFCNDSGDDNDWNDLVVVFSLYNQSTD